MNTPAASAADDAPPPCQLPDLSPRRPTIVVPPGACDCHAHIWAPPGRYPYRPNRRHTPAAAGIAEYRHMLAALGLERAVIVQTGIYPDNQVTLDAIGTSNGTWRGIALLKAGVSDREIERLHGAGFRGVRFNPRNEKETGLNGIEEVAARIKQYGWHLQLHLDARDLTQIGARLERLPTDLVIDHFGHMPTAEGLTHPGFQRLLGMLRERRCWVKLSAPNRFREPRPPYPALIPYAHALIEAAPDRVVWASDWPHSRFKGYMPNDGELLDLLALWAPDAGLRQKILVDNPAQLYDFPR